MTTEPTDFLCPFCGALPGFPCVTVDGIARPPHSTRKAPAKRPDVARENEMIEALRDRLEGTVDPRKYLATDIADGKFTAQEVEHLAQKFSFVCHLGVEDSHRMPSWDDICRA